MPNGFITHSERQNPQRSAAITQITHPQISFTLRPVGRTTPSSPCGRKNSPHIPVEYGTTTPIPSWPGLTRPPSARTSVRVRDLNSGGRESGTQLSLSRARARHLGGRLKPGHDAEQPNATKASREVAKCVKEEEREMNHQGQQDHQDHQDALPTPTNRPRAQRAIVALRADQASFQGAEHLGDLGVLGGSNSFLRVYSRLRVRPLIEPRD